MRADDLDLLREFTREQSQDAFTQLVQRHLNLVYCAALRQVRSPQLAEEVAQSVFTDLSREAGRLKRGTVLGAWLYQVTRRTAIDVVRRESRRQLREQIASERNAMNATADDWKQIEPLLDEAMHALDDTDRTAVLLRYFENKSLREVGEALGATDDAARKRVNRAVDRLREFFAEHGVSVSASGLVLVISANAIQAAPVGLAIAISAAVALTGTTVATTTAIATATKTIAMTTLQKNLVATALAAAIGAGVYESVQASRARTELELLRQRQAEQNQQARQELDETSAKLTALTDENTRLKNASTELLRLRAEVTRLRGAERELARIRAAVPAPANPPAAVPDAEANETELTRDSWANVGFGSPRAVLRTLGWSILNTNLDRFAEAVFVTERTRQAFAEQINRMLAAAGNSEQAKAVARQMSANKVAVEEGLFTRFRGENIGGTYTGYRILSQQTPSPEETIMEIESRTETRPPRTETMTFRKFGNEWKLVIDKSPAK